MQQPITLFLVLLLLSSCGNKLQTTSPQNTAIPVRELVVIPNSNTIPLGMNYTAEVFFAPRDTTSNTRLYITEDIMPYDSVLKNNQWKFIKKAGLNYQTIQADPATARAIYTHTTTATGICHWGGLIEQINPEGDTLMQAFKKQYHITANNLSITPTRMNILYRGIDNPVAISVAGLPDEQLMASMSNGQINRKGKGYTARPGRGKTCKIMVSSFDSDGSRKQIGTREYTVKNVPNPVPYFSGNNSGCITRGKLMASNGVMAKLEDFEFDLKYTVTEFTLSATIQGKVIELKTRGNRITSHQKTLLKSLKQGTKFYIEKIKAKGPDGRTCYLPTMVFKIV